MPRPNKPRAVLAESHLAGRIAMEREARGWTNDGLAKRMTDAGCPMSGSAIFKIEKGDPPRRIVVDELVAFSKVFGVPVQDLLVPPEIADRAELIKLVIDWVAADDAANIAAIAANEQRANSEAAWAAVQAWATGHPDDTETLESLFASWSERYEPEHREDAKAYRMWKATGDEAWFEILRATAKGDQ